MLYIFLPRIKNGWFLPFYLYSLLLNNILNKNKIKCSITNKIFNNSIYIIFQPFYKKIYKNLVKNNNKIIFINSESLLVQKYILNDVKNNNIIMILDYCRQNINEYIKNNINKAVFYSPFTYNIEIEKYFNNKLNNNLNKDIDIFFYGWENDRRKYIKNIFLENNINYISGMYNFDDNEFYNKLSRSKIILVIHYYEEDKPIDFYRINMLLSNKVFFIHETALTEKNNDFDKIIYSDYDKLYKTCIKYLNMTQEERNDITKKQYDWWKNNHNINKYIPIEEIKKIL